MGQMDGERPAAGVLSSRTLWLRYGADATNRNRMRAALQRSFLRKFLDRPEDCPLIGSVPSTTSNRQSKHSPNASAAMPPSIHWPHFLADSQSTPPIHRCAVLFPTLRSKPVSCAATSTGQFPGEDISDLGDMAAGPTTYPMCCRTIVILFFGHRDFASFPKNSTTSSERETIRPLVRAIVLSNAYHDQSVRLINPQGTHGASKRFLETRFPMMSNGHTNFVY